TESSPDFLTKVERRCQVVGGAVMVLGHLRQRLPALPEELETERDPLHPGPTGAADVLEQHCGRRAGPAGVVRIVSVALEEEVVAEPFRLFIGVCVATDPGEEAGVVDDASLGLAETEVISQPE